MTKFKKAPRLLPVRVQDSQCKSVCSDDNFQVFDENGKEGNVIIRKSASYDMFFYLLIFSYMMQWDAQKSVL